MRTVSLMALGAAPSVAIGYLVLTGYILNKVRPLPITRVPNNVRALPISRVPSPALVRRRPLAAAAAR